MERKKLYRSSSDRAIAGVCGGLAEYFDIDPLIIRLLFVLASLGAGTGVLAYVIAAFVIPSEEVARGTYYTVRGQYNAGGQSYVNSAYENKAETGRFEPEQPLQSDNYAEYARTSAASVRDGVSDEYDAVDASTAEDKASAAVTEALNPAEAETPNTAEAEALKPAEAETSNPAEAETTKPAEPEPFRPSEAGTYRPAAPNTTDSSGRAASGLYRGSSEKRDRSRKTVGIALIAVGAIVLVKVIFPHIDMRIVWGVCSILAGLWLVSGK